MKTYKLLTAAILSVAAGYANATPIYLNNGFDFAAGDGTQKNATSTGVVDEMTLHYWSNTTLTDTNGDGVFSAGDTANSTGGFMNDLLSGVGSTSFSQNRITDLVPGFDPANPLTTPSTNGLNQAAGWGLGLGFNNLQATVNAAGGLSYTSGDIIFQYHDFKTNATINVLDLAITSGTNNGIGQSLDLNGTVTVLNQAALISGGLTIAQLFNFDLNGGISFVDWLAANPLATIKWDNNQNTSPFYVNGIQTTNPADLVGIYGGVKGGSGFLSGEHDGSVTFNVPEPASVALLGIGLLGLGLSRRKDA